MPKANAPMIKLESGCEPPILSCNVPEPTSYSGTNLIQLEQFGDEYFKPSVKEKPPKTTRTPLKDIDSATARGAVLSSMRTGFSDRKLFPNIKMTTGTLRILETAEPVSEVVSAIPASSILTKVNADEVASMMVAGKRLNVYRTMYGPLSYNYIDDPVTVTPRVYL